MFAHGGDAEGDVFFERDAEFFGAFDYIFTADASREGFVFHALFDGAGFKIEDALRRTDVGAGGEEAGELIAGKKCVLKRRFAWDAAVIGVGEDGADHFFRIAVLAENFGALGGMFAVGSVVVVGPTLVVEVVEEGNEAPELLVGTKFAGVGADTGLDGKHVFAQTFGLSVFTEKFPGIVAGRHGSSQKRHPL